jgi:hypothetical protein
MNTTETKKQEIVETSLNNADSARSLNQQELKLNLDELNYSFSYGEHRSGGGA